MKLYRNGSNGKRAGAGREMVVIQMDCLMRDPVTQLQAQNQTVNMVATTVMGLILFCQKMM